MKGENKREITILAVDDNPTDLKLIERALVSGGYKLITAKDGEEAVKIARVHKPDLILMDILMPKMSGYTACLEIKKDPKTKDIPIIMLTALGQELHRGLAKNIEAAGYIVKPINVKDLYNSVNEFLQSH